MSNTACRGGIYNVAEAFLFLKLTDFFFKILNQCRKLHVQFMLYHLPRFAAADAVLQHTSVQTFAFQLTLRSNPKTRDVRLSSGPISTSEKVVLLHL